MMNLSSDYCIAEFVKHGTSDRIYRLDTRIYLHPLAIPSRNRGKCIAAVIGKNPGSATNSRLNVWEPVSLAGDNMIPSVRNRFLQAYAESGKSPRLDEYVRVWNLFYLCDENLIKAKKQISVIKTPLVCGSERQRPKIIWFAWGGNDRILNPFKQRFLGRTFVEKFYYDYEHKRIESKAPTNLSSVKHTQGMKERPIVEHLLGIL